MSCTPAGLLPVYPSGGDRFLIAEPAQWAAATRRPRPDGSSPRPAGTTSAASPGIPNRPATLLIATYSERSLVGGRPWTWAAKYITRLASAVARRGGRHAAGAGGRRRERVELVYPGAVTGSAIWDLAAQDRTMLWTVVGSVAIAS